jgi:predicted outer membrane repeat protein
LNVKIDEVYQHASASPFIFFCGGKILMSTFRARLLSVFVLVCLLAAFPGSYAQAKGSIIYVRQDATGLNDGTSWTDAYTDLGVALYVANEGTQIWVARGQYKPGIHRIQTFHLKDGVGLYGGFVGNETMRDQRDPRTNVTILSGDIGVLNVTADNSYHVVSGNDSGYARLDGFTVTAGNADGESDCNGGGLLFHTIDPDTTLKLENVIFSNNSARCTGGGLYARDGYVELDHVTFVNNKATELGYGGGLISHSTMTLNHVIFRNNLAATLGGAIFNEGNMTISSSTFYINRTRSAEGGGAGIFNLDGGILTVSNSTFYENSTSGFGGALYNSGTATVSYSTFSYNSAAQGAAGVQNTTGDLMLNNSILADSLSGPDCATYLGSFSGGHNLVESSDSFACGLPMLTSDPNLGPLAHNGGYTPTLALLPGSPAIDAGNDAVCPTHDQRGIIRPKGSHCDLGAYELVP